MKSTLFKMAFLVAVSTAMGLANTASASTVAFVGNDLDTTATQDSGGYWRTAAVAKANDIDGDNILGTDGFRYVTDNPGGNGANDVESMDSSYATFANLTATNFRGNGNYTTIDDPDVVGGTLNSGTFNPQGAGITGEGTEVSFGTINFTTNAVTATSVTTARIGIMVDNLDNVIFNSYQLRLEDVTSGQTTGPILTQAATGVDNQLPDWYYFDVTNFVVGDQIEVFATSSEGNPPQTAWPATIGAFTLDSVTVTTAVPEPCSATLLGLGGFALMLRRRR